MPVKQATAASDDILGFKKDVFINMIKWGAIAGAVSGLIDFVGGIVSSFVSYAGLLGFVTTGLFAPFVLVNDLFWGAFWGILVGFFIVKFHDKLPFKSLFMKLFGIALIIDIFFGLLGGALLLLFAGPLTAVVWIVTIIVADFVFAKMFASKVAPTVGLS